MRVTIVHVIVESWSRSRNFKNDRAVTCEPELGAESESQVQIGVVSRSQSLDLELTESGVESPWSPSPSFTNFSPNGVEVTKNLVHFLKSCAHLGVEVGVGFVEGTGLRII